MDFNPVKKSIKVLSVSLILITTIHQSVMGQNISEMQLAFKQSYMLEYRGEYSKAISALQSVYDEDSYELNLRLGWLSYLAGLFNESQAYYQKAIEIRPLSIEARFGLINPAAANKKWEVVKKYYTEILDLDPQNKQANYNLGLIYYNNRNYNKAEQKFEQIVNYYPFDFDGLNMYAWTCLKLGKIREAKVLFYKVLLYKPGDKSALKGLEQIQ